MELKKYLLPFICVLIISVTACTSDDVIEEATPRQSESQGNAAPVATSIRVVKDSTNVVRVDNITSTRIKYTEHTSTPRTRRKN